MITRRRLASAIREVDDATRCRLELSAWQEKRSADPDLYAKASVEDLEKTKVRLRVFGDLVALIPYIDSLLARVGQLERSCDVLETLCLHLELLAFVRVWFELCATEPVEQAEYERLEAEARSRMIPLHELIDQVEDDIPEAFLGGSAEVEHQVRELVAAGELKGEVTEEGLCIRAGDFHDVVGTRIHMHSAYGGGFVIVPPGTRIQVDVDRRLLALMRDMVAVLPTEMPISIERILEGAYGSQDTHTRDAALDLHAVRLGHDVQNLHREFTGFRAAVQEVARELFYGNNPMLPDLAAACEDASSRLVALAVNLESYGHFIELGEAERESVELARAYILRSISTRKSPGAERKRRGS